MNVRILIHVFICSVSVYMSVLFSNKIIKKTIIKQ